MKKIIVMLTIAASLMLVPVAQAGVKIDRAVAQTASGLDRLGYNVERTSNRKVEKGLFNVAYFVRGTYPDQTAVWCFHQMHVGPRGHIRQDSLACF